MAVEGADRMTEAVSTALVSYVTEAIDALSWEPGRVVYVAPGDQVAWDDCCEGQIWSRIIGITPAQSQRNAPRGWVGNAGVCGVTHYIIEVEIGLLRCASVVDDQGQAPAAATIGAEGLATLEDSMAILSAISCSKFTRQIGRYFPMGPQGGCVGGRWTFDMRLDNCLECE